VHVSPPQACWIASVTFSLEPHRHLCCVCSDAHAFALLVWLQELRARRVAQEHIDAALMAVFGDSKQISSRDSSKDSQDGESAHRLVDLTKVMLQCTLSLDVDHMLKVQPRLSSGQVLGFLSSQPALQGTAGQRWL
jgi:hypothetical protein